MDNAKKKAMEKYLEMKDKEKQRAAMEKLFTDPKWNEGGDKLKEEIISERKEKSKTNARKMFRTK